MNTKVISAAANAFWVWLSFHTLAAVVESEPTALTRNRLGLCPDAESNAIQRPILMPINSTPLLVSKVAPFGEFTQIGTRASVSSLARSVWQ